MTNDDVLSLIRRCRLKTGEILIPNKAYLIKRKFLTRIGIKFSSNEEEIIVLVEKGKRLVAFIVWVRVTYTAFYMKNIEINT